MGQYRRRADHQPLRHGLGRALSAHGTLATDPAARGPGDAPGASPAPVPPAGAPAAPRRGLPGRVRWPVAAALAALAIAVAIALARGGVSAQAAHASWIVGLALGVTLQRGRFCFFCIFRELIEERRGGGMLAVFTALAVGSVGYAVLLSVWVPNPALRLPPDAHVGPVSWALVVAGLAFGVGMALAGGCISALLYRLGEGYGRAPFGLVGALIGFGIGFITWRPLYLGAIADAPVVWLPASLGHGGALTAQLGLLLLLSAGLLLLRQETPAEPAGRWTPRRVVDTVFTRRWPPLATGAAVGAIGVAAFFRVEPLGVTAQLGSLARTGLDGAGLLSGRLPGLDALAGCATVVAGFVLENGWLVMALVVGAAAAAFASDRFRPSRPTVRSAATATLGGVLMGWGAMTALGCTIGVLLSGIMAGALSGWVFFAACFSGVWLAVKAGLHRA